MIPLLKEGNYTTAYIDSLPEGERVELINGVIYDMAAPSRIHQRLIMNLSYSILDYIKKNNGSCEVYPAPFAVYLNSDDKTYVEPDVSVICDKNKLTDKGCDGAPDFIIEIVSPSSRKLDYSVKNAYYSEAGVREYWIVDPEKERTTVYRYETDSAPVIIPFAQDISAGIYPGLSLNIAELMK